MHIVARKIKQLYREDLVTASQTGILPAWLGLALDEVSRNWHADTRENERAAWMNYFLVVVGAMLRLSLQNITSIFELSEFKVKSSSSEKILM